MATVVVMLSFLRSSFPTFTPFAQPFFLTDTPHLDVLPFVPTVWAIFLRGTPDPGRGAAEPSRDDSPVPFPPSILLCLEPHCTSFGADLA